MNKILKCFLLTLMGISFVFAQKTRLDGIAAVVGDETILESELNAYTLMRLNGLQIKPDSVDLKKYRSQFLQELIDGKVLIAYAKEDTNIVVKNEEIDQMLDNHIKMILKQNNLTQDSLEKILLREQGMPFSKFRAETRKAIKDQLIKQKVQQAHVSDVKVSRRDVEEFYRQYKDSLPQAGESVLLSKITLKITPSDSMRQAAFSKIQKVHKQLTNGGDFAELAKKYSEGVEATSGGDLGLIAKGSLTELSFEEKIFSLPTGQISEPFETRLGFHIAQVLTKRDQTVHVRQIFVSVAATDQQVQKVMDRLDSIAKVSVSTEDFAKAAQKYSVDNATKTHGGKMGWFALYDLSSNVRTAIDTLGKGAITKPVRDESYISIYRIDDRVKNRALTLENDWAILAEKTKDILTQKKLIALVNKWRQDVYVDVR